MAGNGSAGFGTLKPAWAKLPLDPRVKRFLDLLAAGNPPDARSISVEERRKGLAELMKLAGPQVAVGRVEDRTLPGPGGALPVRIYSPVGAAEILPGLLYFHGGGLVAGSIATHDSIARALTNSGAVPRGIGRIPAGSRASLSRRA